jgi:ABC transport system ATP-binding/permease protein
MLGLVISDSFKAVVTIYMIIPFLVIPQIIFSGVMVKYEKLNPHALSSPVEIPFYGEAITARWGYEALAVEQFVNNRYEKQFYPFEKITSNASYIKLYWKDSVNERLMNIERNLSNTNRDDSFADDLDFVRFEIIKQLAAYPKIPFDFIDQLTTEKVTGEVIQAAKKYIEETRQAYIGIYNKKNDEKEKIKANLQQTLGKEGFNKLYNNYFNDKLKEFVTNGNDMEKTIVYNNRLYQKMDPIYMDPEYKFIKAHFYSPEKLVFGLPVRTLIVNVLVLWFKTGLFYLALYFRLLKKLLDSAELIMGKSGKGGD